MKTPANTATHVTDKERQSWAEWADRRIMAREAWRMEALDNYPEQLEVTPDGFRMSNAAMAITVAAWWLLMHLKGTLWH